MYSTVVKSTVEMAPPLFFTCVYSYLLFEYNTSILAIGRLLRIF